MFLSNLQKFESCQFLNLKYKHVPTASWPDMLEFFSLSYNGLCYLEKKKKKVRVEGYELNDSISIQYNFPRDIHHTLANFRPIIWAK